MNTHVANAEDFRIEDLRNGSEWWQYGLQPGDCGRGAHRYARRRASAFFLPDRLRHIGRCLKLLFRQRIERGHHIVACLACALYRRWSACPRDSECLSTPPEF
ncbi:hypothetical protein QCE88_39515 [Caballeronia sp. LZ035]|nr:MULTISPECIES: hypothetical protein [unclassified Caballeronia]MDR5763093.1 hypothetical protein [Caballeronia sp. LZ035]MDR5883928.1 hypothetical protein [Caballeronia sp. LZ032]